MPKTYDCRGCAYEGPMPERACPECDTKLPGRVPGSKAKPRARTGVPTERLGLRVGPAGVAMMGDLREMTKLDDSKILRLALGSMHQLTRGRRSASGAIEALALDNDVLDMALKQR